MIDLIWMRVVAYGVTPLSTEEAVIIIIIHHQKYYSPAGT